MSSHVAHPIGPRRLDLADHTTRSPRSGFRRAPVNALHARRTRHCSRQRDGELGGDLDVGIPTLIVWSRVHAVRGSGFASLLEQHAADRRAAAGSGTTCSHGRSALPRRPTSPPLPQSGRTAQPLVRRNDVDCPGAEFAGDRSRLCGEPERERFVAGSPQRILGNDQSAALGSRDRAVEQARDLTVQIAARCAFGVHLVDSPSRHRAFHGHNRYDVVDDRVGGCLRDQRQRLTKDGIRYQGS
jgi:hypothetical protein